MKGNPNKQLQQLRTRINEVNGFIRYSKTPEDVRRGYIKERDLLLEEWQAVTDYIKTTHMESSK